jgi:hypothetical protein
MLIVTGTKRSGTSLWMRLLISAGFPAFGEAFPGDWEEKLRSANPDGFFESLLREGIYHATNPHPQTGDYFFPEQVEWHCVKVFIPGLVRTDRAYIGRVIATVREWREHSASLARLHALENAERARADSSLDPPVHMPPELEWWTENFSLVRDIAIRRYAVHVQSYDGMMADPERVLHDVVGWLGRGDAARALGAVKVHRRSEARPDVPGVDPDVAEVFDELYAVIDRGEGLSAALLGKLNETNAKLLPTIREHQELVLADLARRRVEPDRSSG